MLFLLFNNFEFKHDSYLFDECHRKFHVFQKAFLIGQVINQGREIYSGRRMFDQRKCYGDVTC